MITPGQQLAPGEVVGGEQFERDHEQREVEGERDDDAGDDRRARDGSEEPTKPATTAETIASVPSRREHAEAAQARVEEVRAVLEAARSRCG